MHAPLAASAPHSPAAPPGEPGDMGSLYSQQQSELLQAMGQRHNIPNTDSEGCNNVLNLTFI